MKIKIYSKFQYFNPNDTEIFKVYLETDDGVIIKEGNEFSLESYKKMNKKSFHKFVKEVEKSVNDFINEKIIKGK